MKANLRRGDFNLWVIIESRKTGKMIHWGREGGGHHLLKTCDVQAQKQIELLLLISRSFNNKLNENVRLFDSC